VVLCEDGQGRNPATRTAGEGDIKQTVVSGVVVAGKHLAATPAQQSPQTRRADAVITFYCHTSHVASSLTVPSCKICAKYYCTCFRNAHKRLVRDHRPICCAYSNFLFNTPHAPRGQSTPQPSSRLQFRPLHPSRK
jgi:hypothetical protein